MLTSAERGRIEQAVAAAEARTSGEIVCILARRTSYYRSVPLAFAALAGLIIPAPLLAFTALSAERIYLAQLIVTLGCALVLAVPAIRMRAVPGTVKRRRARDAARREFAARGLALTRERTGVLIFVAAAERYAEIIADQGIASRVPAEVWRETVTALIDALAAGRPAEGLVGAVERVGAVLAAHFPPRDHADEISNRVVLI